MQHRAFVGDPLARQRYWARSMIGWEKFKRARPNPAHAALAELETQDRLAGIITQNVDRLHQAAGSRRVVELHGALAEVRCLGCSRIEQREELQRRLVAMNPGFAELVAEAAPDGDADLAEELVRNLRVAACEVCAGVLKPHVVFFGDSVPRATVDAAFELLDAAEALLVVGSSLAVFSGYRFVRRACERHVPIVLVNLGPTRADEVCTVKLELAAGLALPAIVQSVLSHVPAAI